MNERHRKSLDRANTSQIGRWWWTIDRLNLFALIMLMGIGIVLVVAASPPVAARIHLQEFHFVTRQVIFLSAAFVIMIGISMLNVHHIRRIAVLGFLMLLLVLAVLPMIGTEHKGSTRWMYLMGFSLQPSEIIKPFFAVVIAWLFAEKQRSVHFPGYKISIACYFLLAGLLIIQPDFGMVVTISVMYGMQWFLAGLPWIWVILMVLIGIGGVVLAYVSLPHVAHRINSFIDPASSDNYQVSKSLEAFESGGLLGRGPGEGVVKWSIPDSHTDFIFAVAGEEFGVAICLLIIFLYGFILLRGFARVWHESNLFVLLAASGILVQFGTQAIINMGVAVNVLPPKGMTLPFLSYGGSSLLGIALGMGMVLGLTRRRYGVLDGVIGRYQTI